MKNDSLLSDHKKILMTIAESWPHVPASQMRMATYGKSGAQVIILDRHVVKMLNDLTCKPDFDREERLLQNIQNTLASRNTTALQFFGLDMPGLEKPITLPKQPVFIMSRVVGIPLSDAAPQIAKETIQQCPEKIAKFYVGLDRMYENINPNDLLNEQKLCICAENMRWPEYLRDMQDLVPASLCEAQKPSPAKARFIYNDMNSGNIMINPETCSINGIVDFGQTYYGDPHYGMAKLLLNSATAHGNAGLQITTELIEQLNGLCGQDGWCDMRRAIALMPIMLANSLDWLIWQGKARGQDLVNREFYSKTEKCIKYLYDKWHIGINNRELPERTNIKAEKAGFQLRLS